MIRIPLPARDGSLHGYALVDDEDRKLAEVRWSYAPGHYAFRRRRDETVYLHREVLGLTKGDGLQADHINGDRLDNRRANLRVVTHRQNCENHRRGRGTSRFRGVYWNKHSQKWMARVKVDYRHRYLGVFDDEVEAARVAEAYRREHMPFSQPDPELAALEEYVARNAERLAA